MKYAESYANSKTKKNPSIIIAATIPGNPYPIIKNPFLNGNQNPKGFYGSAIKAGFQSHATIVNYETFPYCKILEPWNPFCNSYSVDELVVHTPQKLPIFIIKLKPEIECKKKLT